MERKVMKAMTAMMENTAPTQKKNLSPFSQVLQKSCRYMMCVIKVQRASTPDSPPMAAVHGWLYAMFHTRNAEKPMRVPKDEYPILTYVLFIAIMSKKDLPKLA